MAAAAKFSRLTLLIFWPILQRLPPRVVAVMSLAPTLSLEAYCLDVAQRASRAAAELACASGADKDRWLRLGAKRLRERAPAVLAANVQDIAAAPSFGLTAAAIDRLRLTAPGIAAIAQALADVAAL